MSTRNLHDFKFRSSYVTNTDGVRQTIWFECCRPFQSQPTTSAEIPKQIVFDEECVENYYNYLIKWHEAAELAMLPITRGDNTSLSTGWPGDIAISWQLQADGTPADGWDPESGLPKIFYDANGHEINKNALQIFRGIPLQVDFPMFFSPLVL